MLRIVGLRICKKNDELPGSGLRKARDNGKSPTMLALAIYFSPLVKEPRGFHLLLVGFQNIQCPRFNRCHK